MEQIKDKENLYQAYSKALSGKRGKADVVAYGRKVAHNIILLQQQLDTGNWDIGHYHYFRIYDPKERLICAASFPERVLHHAIMNVCHPYFDKMLIETTYASRIGKGTYAAIEKAREGASRYTYVAKLDVRKYFDSINHQVLKEKLRGIFKDGHLLQLLDDIIDSYEVKQGIGLPIGNLTSQYVANFYLSEVDHLIKEQFKVPCYIRYMDDMLLYGNDKAQLKQQVEQVRSQLGLIGLQLKPVQYYRTEQGVPFLGYRIYPKKLLLLGRSKRRFFHKYIVLHKLLESGDITEREYTKRILPLLNYVQKGYTKRYRLSILGRTA